MNAYEQRLERRRERLRARAAKVRAEAERRYQAADDILGRIPPGQPILVGHHSEKGHRRDLGRVDSNMRKAVDATKRAGELEGRAAGVGTGGISSDDPEAIDKLTAKRVRLAAVQERMKAANKALRKNDTAALHALGFGDVEITALFQPDFCGRIGFADYQLSNNRAELRRVEQRIAALKARADAESSETETADGVRIVENVEENRLQIFFPGKPDAAMRKQLKSCGFRWAPSVGAWQRQLSNAARFWANQIVG